MAVWIGGGRAFSAVLTPFFVGLKPFWLKPFVDRILFCGSQTAKGKLFESPRSMKAWWFCCFLFLGLPLDGECDSDLALLDEEVDLSLANTELCH